MENTSTEELSDGLPSIPMIMIIQLIFLLHRLIHGRIHIYNVPISTASFVGANTNLSCVVDCSTDGGYSIVPINILTDCTTASSLLKRMARNAWVPLNDPPQSGLEWSIVTFIDLRRRSDGFINNTPVPNFISPQHVTVNKTIQITIPVSDANIDDDVRCRWSAYTPGYRRRKRSNSEENYDNHHYTV
ncbi:unnamed protein product [Rotaria magnacalcarata]|uniref:Uncharacterized protein n=3 Tax=Rotaria magnacalcarata TaxID=392030 RepID=A0A816ZTY2_9BILA|nr:unnamed protein product [Rotaria magnacalcarata]